MKKLAISLFAFGVLFSACSGGSPNVQQSAMGGGMTNDSDKPTMQETESGMKYALHTQNEGQKPKIDDYLTLHMSYATKNDSTVFTSFNRKRPLTFRFSKTLFRGALNEGLMLMSKNDSATFQVPVESVYGSRLPGFVEAGELLTYQVKLLDVQSADEYQQKILEKSNSQKQTQPAK